MIHEEGLTEFSGVAGRVLLRSVSAGSLITGVTVGFVLLAGNGILVAARAPALSTPFTQIVLALALARFAVNGLHGEWAGTIFSVRGGSWARVTQVALRYLAMTAVWMLPMIWLGMGLDQEGAATMSLANGKILGFALFYVLAMTLTPPLFLVAAVSAESFADAFRPGHWKALFSSRLGDLFMVYVAYTGTLGMVLILSLPPVAAALGVNVRFGILVAALTFCMFFGISVNLLGRLAGFFACGELDLAAPSGPATVAPRAPEGPGAADGTTGAPGARFPAGARAEAPAALPVSADSPATAAGTEPPWVPRAVASPAPAAAPPSVARQLADPEALPPVTSVDAAAREKLPPLLDGQERVETELRRFANDPRGALSALRDLHDSFAPHPHVLQALSLCLYRAKQQEAALELATRALPLCLERGHALLAAEIFREMNRHIDRLRLNREQLLMIAGTLARHDDLGAAARAYSTVIGRDPGEQRAIKGLLQVADRVLHERSNPAGAAKVYRYLLAHCAASPLAQFMTDGLAAAERKLAAQPEPVGS